MSLNCDLDLESAKLSNDSHGFCTPTHSDEHLAKVESKSFEVLR